MTIKDERPEGAPKGLVKRGKWYHYIRMFNGKQTKHALNTSDYNHAVRMVLEFNEQIEDKKVSPELAVNKDTHDFAVAADKYTASRNIRENTIVRYTEIAANINSGFERITGKPTTPISEVNRQLVQDYCKLRKTEHISHANAGQQAGIAPKTIQDELDHIKRVLKYAVRQEWLVKMPDLADIHKVKRQKGVMSDVARPLEFEEVQAILKEAAKWDEAHQGKYPYSNYIESMLRLYIYAGLRLNEGRFLEWTDINLKAGIIKVRPKKVTCKRTITFTPETWDKIKGYINFEKNQPAIRNNATALKKVGYALNFKQEDKLRSIKGQDFDLKNMCIHYTEVFNWNPKGSSGEVPIHPCLLTVLTELEKIKISNFVFPSFDGGYFNLKLDYTFNKLTKAAGIKDHIRLHDMRHTLGYLLRRNGVGLEVIKEILRHASIEQTLVYAKYNQEEGQAAINKLPG